MTPHLAHDRPGKDGVLLENFGLSRIAALIANGSGPVHGPRLRALSAGSAALMWGQMRVVLLLRIPNHQGFASPGIPAFFAPTFGELIYAYRAMSDARTLDR
jgi:hypothetical protein